MALVELGLIDWRASEESETILSVVEGEHDT